MTTITPEQRMAASQAGDSPIELFDPLTGAYVLVRAEVYQKMGDLLAEDEDRREREAWARLASKARDQRLRDEPDLMIRPGEFHPADTEVGRRAVAIVSRQENSGLDIAAGP